MEKLIWCLKQLLPLKYQTKYQTPGGIKYNAIWRMWLGKCFAINHWMA